MALHGRMVSNSKKKVLLMRYSSVILLIQIIQYGQENMVLYLSSSMRKYCSEYCTYTLVVLQIVI